MADGTSERKTVKIGIGLPFYDGPDIHTFEDYFRHMAYYGRLKERCIFRQLLSDKDWQTVKADLPPLDPDSGTGLSELQDDDPSFDFCFISEVKNSLIGQAREHIVERALEFGCDYVFFFDNDIKFAKETLIRLYRHRKPVVFALAFAARAPIAPVIFKFIKKGSDVNIQWLLDYPKNALFRVDGHGAGVVLMDCKALRRIGKGWFNSQGSGEDIHFAIKCAENGIPMYCDSSIWTAHKPNFPMYWHDEAYFDSQREHHVKLHQHELTTRMLEDAVV